MRLLVGLPAVRLLGVDDVVGGPIVVHVELEATVPACPGCGGRARVKDRPPVVLVDLPYLIGELRQLGCVVRLDEAQGKDRPRPSTRSGQPPPIPAQT